MKSLTGLTISIIVALLAVMIIDLYSLKKRESSRIPSTQHHLILSSAAAH